MAVTAAFQTELDRLAAYVATLKASVTPDTGPVVASEDATALSAALDAAGAPAPAPAAPVA